MVGADGISVPWWRCDCDGVLDVQCTSTTESRGLDSRVPAFWQKRCLLKLLWDDGVCIMVESFGLNSVGRQQNLGLRWALASRFRLTAIENRKRRSIVGIHLPIATRLEPVVTVQRLSIASSMTLYWISWGHLRKQMKWVERYTGVYLVLYVFDFCS